MAIDLTTDDAGWFLDEAVRGYWSCDEHEQGRDEAKPLPEICHDH